MLPDLGKAILFKRKVFGDSIDCECAEQVLIDLAYGSFAGGFDYMTEFKDFIVASNWDGAADYL